MPRKQKYSDAQLIEVVVKTVEHAGGSMPRKDLIKYLKEQGVQTAGSGWVKRFWKPAGLRHMGEAKMGFAATTPPAPAASAQPLKAQVTRTYKSGEVVHEFETTEAVNFPDGEGGRVQIRPGNGRIRVVVTIVTSLVVTLVIAVIGTII